MKQTVGDRFIVTWEELGRPITPGDKKLPNGERLVLDDADVHYAKTTPDATFFIRRAARLGPDYWVVISRVHPDDQRVS